MVGTTFHGRRRVMEQQVTKEFDVHIVVVVVVIEKV